MVLKEDGSAVSTTSFTKITLSLDNQTISSTNEADDPIRWNQSGYATGEFRIDLSGETVNVGEHEAVVTAYDAANTDGVIWKHTTGSELIIVVIRDPEVA